ncbi:MAG: 16S rRNA (cytosine(1402)-N(4))-methyltransferase RsmH [Clostridia bacterium]|nr:16S rRNA (cytosine(1402)-N(4))-methyltransferase RsmH [Clostridia bacterium]
MEFKHIPVMLEECLEGLNLKDNAVYVDATIGGAGHSKEILKRTKNTKLVGIDQDKQALSASKTNLKNFGNRVVLVHNNFKNINSVLDELGISKVDGVLIDLGVSSHQIDTPNRGFSFRFDAPLDMRMNQENKLSAYDVVNTYSEAELRKIIYDYGEERFAGKIARHIVEARKKASIKTTFELRDLILASVPRYRGQDGQSNVQRTFQAIRIEVNGELAILKQAIIDCASRLKQGGRLVILTFHSLEDRIVKTTFKELSLNCTCPPEFPVCVCGGNNATLILVNHKPIEASESERENNSRSICAKLRIAEKIKQD